MPGSRSRTACPCSRTPARATARFLDGRPIEGVRELRAGSLIQLGDVPLRVVPGRRGRIRRRAHRDRPGRVELRRAAGRARRACCCRRRRERGDHAAAARALRLGAQAPRAGGGLGALRPARSARRGVRASHDDRGGPASGCSTASARSPPCSRWRRSSSAAPAPRRWPAADGSRRARPAAWQRGRRRRPGAEPAERAAPARAAAGVGLVVLRRLRRAALRARRVGALPAARAGRAGGARRGRRGGVLLPGGAPLRHALRGRQPHGRGRGGVRGRAPRARDAARARRTASPAPPTAGACRARASSSC